VSTDLNIAAKPQTFSAKRFWIWLAGILSVGFALRYVLAFVPIQLLSGQGLNNYGFSWDMSTFADWMFTIRSSGSSAYLVDPSINYPPVFADVLALLNGIGDIFSGGDPTTAQRISITLLKLPAIVADLGVAFTVAFAGRKWFSAKTGLWAAALYVVIPVTWYDSAVWGQVDSISALFMLLAVVMIADRKPEWSALFVVMAILTKPQGVLVGLVIAPIFVGLLVKHELKLWRIATTLGAAVISFAALAAPWNLRSYNSDGLANIPVIGDVTGLWIQFKSTAGLFPVLTANAYNPWALAGDGPLAPQFQHNVAAWSLDNFEILGVQANVLGNILFLAAAGLVFWYLVRNPSVQNALLGFAVVLVAFYDLPTRVHERYLVQAFAILCLVWAVKWWDRAALVVLATANALNLHAILSTGLNVMFPPMPPTNDVVFQHHGLSPDNYGIGGVPFEAGFTRDAWLVYLIIAIQLVAMFYLIWQLIDTNSRKRGAL
jgi:Gpi18-like mannosyltransferase